jgi:hypothetical protein
LYDDLLRGNGQRFRTDDADVGRLLRNADSRCCGSYAMADHLAKGPARAEQISTIEGMVILTGRERTLAEDYGLPEYTGLRFFKHTPNRCPMAVN